MPHEYNAIWPGHWNLDYETSENKQVHVQYGMLPLNVIQTSHLTGCYQVAMYTYSVILFVQATSFNEHYAFLRGSLSSAIAYMVILCYYSEYKFLLID